MLREYTVTAYSPFKDAWREEITHLVLCQLRQLGLVFGHEALFLGLQRVDLLL
jgi:hypothetical protein